MQIAKVAQKGILGKGKIYFFNVSKVLLATTVSTSMSLTLMSGGCQPTLKAGLVGFLNPTTVAF